MIHSSCLCGRVRWDLDGPFVFLHHCHCGRCRRAHGTPFSTMVAGSADSLEVTGGDAIVRWESATGVIRPFCGTCGSKVPGAAFQDLMFVPAGNLDEDPGVPVEGHIFVGSKARWYEIPDALPRFDAFPDGIDAPVFPDLEPAGEPGAVRGGCLCRAITFRVEAPPIRAHYCHCGRCRKARSAAHAANMFVEAGGVRFTSGEERLRSYKLPDAERFTQAFCGTCGAIMPWTHSGLWTVVPMGSLDDDPGIRPHSHIFVGSKAPWFEIADGLPQFAERPTG
jgi:hypothetical protein